MAVFIYNKDPNVEKNQPPAKLTEKLLNHIREAAKQRGENTALFDNPRLSSLADGEVLKKLSAMVDSNPEFQLPEGYKKVEEKHVREIHGIKEDFEIGESTRVCAGVMDDLLEKLFGGHIIEPVAEYFTNTRVIPLAKKLSNQSPQSKVVLRITKNSRNSSVGAQISRPEEIKKLIIKPLPEVSSRLTPAMKFGIVCASPEEKEAITEVVGVIGDIVDAVERGRNHIPNRQGAITNRILKQKAARESELEELKKSLEQKRQMRAGQLKQKMEENKVEKEKRQAEEEQKRLEENERIKKKLAREKERLEEQKKKIVEERQKKEDTNGPPEDAAKVEEEKKKKAEEAKVFKKKKKEEYVIYYQKVNIREPK